MVNNTSQDLYLHKSDPTGARVLAVGEVLWDRLAHSTRLGGAPLNFAAHLRRLGHQPLVVSAVGRDLPGDQASAAIAALGLDTTFLQSSRSYPTGSATVTLAPGDQTTFTIARPAAYDACSLSDSDLDRLARWNPQWLYFGTLFPSRPETRRLLERIVESVPRAICMYDLNLRPGFDSPDLVHELLTAADVVKLNEHELQFVHDRLDLPGEAEAFCRIGSERYGWRAACVTLAARGCAMFAADHFVSAPAIEIDVADPVGAGDAFAAAFVHGLISGWPAERIARVANEAGAHVAAAHGAIPDCLAQPAARP